MAFSATDKAALNRNWFTITSLVTKDFKLKYRRSVLGIAWSVLNPLLMMCVLSAVFSSAMSSIIDSAPLIKKIRIEKLIFPLEKVLFTLVNFVISLIAVALVMLFFRIVPTWNLLLLPLLILYVTIFSAGIGLILATLAVFFRDVLHFWSVIITAWTYATPLFYPVDILPDWMLAFETFNPMYHYVTYFRDIALWGNTPGVGENLVCLGMALVMLVLGLVVFKKNEKKFILYV